MKLFQDAAELGDEKAAFAIGMLYDQGLGVKQSHAEAVKWYQSANQGFKKAYFNLALNTEMVMVLRKMTWLLPIGIARQQSKV